MSVNFNLIICKAIPLYREDGTPMVQPWKDLGSKASEAIENKFGEYAEEQHPYLLYKADGMNARIGAVFIFRPTITVLHNGTDCPLGQYFDTAKDLSKQDLTFENRIDNMLNKFRYDNQIEWRLGHPRWMIIPEWT